MYNVNRFIVKQDEVYDSVLKELKNGKKVSHWMWYIFPQLKDLGSSYNSMYYGIKNKQEAKEYMNNDVLRKRYVECCNILLNLKTNNIEEVLGDIDKLKLKSSLTLFLQIDVLNKELYLKLLEKYYDKKICQKTIDILEIRNQINL